MKSHLASYCLYLHKYHCQLLDKVLHNQRVLDLPLCLDHEVVLLYIEPYYLLLGSLKRRDYLFDHLNIICVYHHFQVCQ